MAAAARAFPRAEALERRSRRCRASGPALKKRLRALGLETVGDLARAPAARYERPLDETPIAELAATRRSRSPATVRRRTLRGARGRLHDPDGDASRTTSGDDLGDVVQPAVARSEATPGTPVRLRGKLGRYGFDVKSLRRRRGAGDRRLRARLSRERGASPRRSCASSSRAALPRRGRRSAAGRAQGAEALPLARDALAALHRPRSLERGRARPPPARVRRAARCCRSASRAPSRARDGGRAGAARAGRARRPLPRRAAVRS